MDQYTQGRLTSQVRRCRRRVMEDQDLCFTRLLAPGADRGGPGATLSPITATGTNYKQMYYLHNSGTLRAGKRTRLTYPDGTSVAGGIEGHVLNVNYTEE